MKVQIRFIKKIKHIVALYSKVMRQSSITRFFWFYFNFSPSAGGA